MSLEDLDPRLVLVREVLSVDGEVRMLRFWKLRIEDAPSVLAFGREWRELKGNRRTTRGEDGTLVGHSPTHGDMAANTSDEHLRTCPVKFAAHRIRHKGWREACLERTHFCEHSPCFSSGRR